MYTYTATSTDTGEELKQKFEDHGDARDFADDNVREFPDYEVYDEEQDMIIYSTSLDKEIEADSRDDMYPEGEDD